MRGPRPKSGVALVKSHEFCRAWSECRIGLMNSVGRGRSAELVTGGGVYQPGFTCTRGVANGGKRFPEQMFPLPPRGILGLGVVCPETDAPYGVKRTGFNHNIGASAQWVPPHGRVLREFENVPARTASSTRSQMWHSKLRTPRPRRLCLRGSTDAIICSAAPWLRRPRAFSAIIYCSSKEYDTSPTNSFENRTTAKHRKGGC